MQWGVSLSLNFKVLTYIYMRSLSDWHGVNICDVWSMLRREVTCKQDLLDLTGFTWILKKIGALSNTPEVSDGFGLSSESICILGSLMFFQSHISAKSKNTNAITINQIRNM